MFALVDEIELYPDFLPWCEKTQVTRNDDEVRATVFINYHGLRTSFSTKNRHQPPDKIDMALTKGPLSSLSGGWRFIDLGDGRSRVEFDLTYRFANRLFAKTFEKLLKNSSVILLIPLLSGRGKNMESPDAGKFACKWWTPNPIPHGNAI